MLNGPAWGRAPYRRYEEICELLRHCLNGYGHTGLTELERKRWERGLRGRRRGRLLSPDGVEVGNVYP